MNVRFAPEVRGTLAFNAVAALSGAVAVFYFAVLPPRADAAALQRWTANAQSTFALPAGAAVALETARGLNPIKDASNR